MEKLKLRPASATYVYNPSVDVISVTLDGGLSRSRRDLVSSAALIECSWELDHREYQYFRAFYNFATNKGAKPFLIDLLLDQPYLQQFQAKFVPETVIMDNPLGLSMVTHAQLEVMPLPDDPEFDEIVLLLFDDNFLDRLAIFANYDLKVSNG